MNTNGNGNGNVIDKEMKNHRGLIIVCITGLGVVCVIMGGYLIMHNHESSGTLLISGGGPSVITGLIGLLSLSRPNAPAQDITVTATPPRAEVKPAGISQPPPPQRT